MKKSEVPQEENRTYGGLRKAVYARDESGRHSVVPSSGWRAEEAATEMAVALFREAAESARQACREGRASPMMVHMYARRMDPPTLAQATGLATWRVRRHLRPGPFRRLPRRLRKRYADALGLSQEQLDRLPDD